ncbi:MAG: hypothetical protein CVU38_13465 [Chloroflexi bacterium HGW-Chloroflexi-1]|nr:MAG: hypothetical protein CVU38_13465 [Chloroflexi bacterium HGW-Chloroflexi-1]
MPEERLQKILARAGLGSRRACEEIIVAGRVTVAGRVVTELGVKVDPAVAEIRVDGRPVVGERHRYIMLHKPAGYLSGADRRAEYPSWQKLVKAPERLFAVGRLDQDSEGLLLLTNDGRLAHRLTHPRYEHPKTYLVQVAGFPDPRKIRRLQHGVMLDDGPTAPAQVILLRQAPEPFAAGGPASESNRRTSWLRVTLHEGRQRQLRRMVGLLGHPARRVIRVGLGPLELTNLPSGKWRDLTPDEVQALRAAARRGAPTDGPVRQPERTTERQPASTPSTIAIDGPSASGKSTIGALLAEELDYLYFDTGVMYRAITWVALARQVPIADEAAVTALAEQVKLEVLAPTVDDGRDVTVLADGEDITTAIRQPKVERAVSPVSAYRGVRAAMTLQQRRIGQAGRVVMVGRDIGTVVMPDADLKIYLDASVRERANRRYREQLARGEKSDLEQVLAEMKRRDHIDSNRQHAPLTAAPDAIVVDSTALDIDEVLVLVRGLLERWATPKAR